MASKRALRALSSAFSASQCTTRSPKACQSLLPRQIVRHQSDSTAPSVYKALHRRVAPLPSPSTPATFSPAAAVSNILYETPIPSSEPPKAHILNCLVQNEPGVLSRISGILAARGFNIDSLVVCSTEVHDLSRMTIVLQGQDGVVEQARRQLEDLVPVWAVLDYTAAPLVQRELLLAKISILGPEYFEELLAHHREMTDAEALAAPREDLTPEQLGVPGEDAVLSAEDYHPSNLAPSEALRLKHQHLETITYLTHQFGGKVLDISTTNCIVEISAKPRRIDSFMKLIAPFGILESARTGMSLASIRSNCSIEETNAAAQVSWPFHGLHYTSRMMLSRRKLRISWIRVRCHQARKRVCRAFSLYLSSVLLYHKCSWRSSTTVGWLMRGSASVCRPLVR